MLLASGDKVVERIARRDRAGGVERDSGRALEKYSGRPISWSSVGSLVSFAAGTALVVQENRLSVSPRRSRVQTLGGLRRSAHRLLRNVVSHKPSAVFIFSLSGKNIFFYFYFNFFLSNTQS